MERIRSFKDLIVWQKAHKLFIDVIKIVELFPKTQATKVVIDQLLRSCGSISANIAEGFGRRQGKEYIHYLIVARGSTTETLNWLIKSRDVGWINKEEYTLLESTIEEIMKMLNKMIGQKMSF